MEKASELRTGRHVVFLLHTHLVFVTKYRKAVFTKNMLHYLENVFQHVCERFEAKLIEFEGEKDHVHLLINYPPKISVSKLVNSLKGVSSRMLRKNFSKDIKKLLWKNVLWSPSYFAGSCGGAPLSTIKQYISKQNSPK